ncbi:UNVERIFIED_CONTAM: TRAF3-interacting protein 1 [Trichonephila clavipes]
MADEIDPDIIKKTQEILGGVIKKPPLTEKSLKKPPFRFLFDIITNIIKTTGFYKGLYTPTELQSDNVKVIKLLLTLIYIIILNFIKF